MRANPSRSRSDEPERNQGAATEVEKTDVDPLFGEEPTVIREDETEVHDLGFIVENRRERATEEGDLSESYTESAAERDEADFAERALLAEDPEAAPADPGDPGWETPATAVDLHGHAPGVAAGFGSELVQDIGAEGFSIKENPPVDRPAPSSAAESRSPRRR